MAPSGCTNKCKKSEKRTCKIFEEKEREEIIYRFWQLIWEKKKVFVCNLVEKHDVKQRTTVDASRRKFSYSYFLTKNGSKLPVCKSMFLSTLGIGEKMMYEWILNSKNGIPHKSNVKRRAKQYDIDRKQYAKSFIERLPKLPSHYCRASSSKVYLEPVFQSISDLHREYRKEAQKDDSPVISLFHNILDELNISLFQPRKDQCDTCCGYEAANIDKVIYDQHIVKKEAARAVITLDLQALLMCPLLKASAMYYKTKLSCHNFTIFDMKTKDVICYFWTEVEGSKVGDNVVTDIRALMYLPEGEIKYKLTMSRDYLELPRRAKISAPRDTDQVANLHNSSLSIKASKYKHLQELKSFVPRDFHAFYDNLPHA
ncbi:unnamed protein product [Mytilus coruscus]|uniref:Uncharacterized protein n=1 Tax=Mytilus coruscus TaxID=42192 RepID=A0A6J8DXT6_MYTCO|nr:unnamed protein product [Mytilus coruscus]